VCEHLSSRVPDAVADGRRDRGRDTRGSNQAGAIMKSGVAIFVGALLLAAGLSGFQLGRMDAEMSRWAGEVLWYQVIGGAAATIIGTYSLLSRNKRKRNEVNR